MVEYRPTSSLKSDYQTLERALRLKQLQINSLLNITQAINGNTKSAGLYSMYKSFLTLELEVSRLALFIHQDHQWNLAVSHKIEGYPQPDRIAERMKDFKRPTRLSLSDDPFFSAFELLIPVFHKDEPIAFAFIGGIDDMDERYNKIQFITTITNIIAVAIENKRLFKQQHKRDLLQREVDLAAKLQKNLVPPSYSYQAKGVADTWMLEADAIYQPHFGVGGDYYDVVELEEKGQIAFCVADIAGKGLAASLLMANLQANFRGLIHNKTDPKDFVIAMNTALCRITNQERFVTMFVAWIDLKQHCIRFINAGHIPPIWITDSESTRLTEGCTILGMFESLPEIEVGSVPFQNHNMLVAFTDGLTDILNEQEEFISEKDLFEFTVRHKNDKPKPFNQVLLDKIKNFSGGIDFPDDLTILTWQIERM